MDPFWLFLAVLQGPPPIPAPPLPTEVTPTMLTTSALVAPDLGVPAAPPAQAAAPVVVTTASQAPAARPAQARPRMVRAKTEFSYVSTGGTNSIQTIGAGAEIVVTPAQWRVETRANYLLSESSEQVRARRTTSSLKAARKVGDRAELFARSTYLRNRFVGLDHSVDAAAGVTAILFKTDPQVLALDSGFGYIGEDRTIGAGRYLGTFDLGLRHSWEFAKKNRISNDTQMKTDVERTSDWRLTHIAALEASLNSRLALKLSHEVNYRNEPVPGFARADTVTSAALVATF